ncbi:ATP-binding cassette domain-containing protein [Streptomyces sp. NBC_00459]|uniref:ATP-binding cassette domain-containing protein n=1 Tax=Streptomyces sp. NBC_00459 TaxID=2975749 RepID=UPI003FA721D8
MTRLGQNGSGKSTLIKILSGVHQPDAGEIVWRGEPVSFTGPRAAMKASIATFYQELDMVPDMSVAENNCLGREPAGPGGVRRAEKRRLAKEVLTRLSHGEIPVGQAVGRLPAAARQIVSMARALSEEARLLIMGEPSTVLAHD